MPKMMVEIEPDFVKRILERFTSDGQKYIKENFQTHPEAQTNPNLRQEYVLDLALAAHLYSQMGFGNINAATQNRQTGLTRALEASGPPATAHAAPPSEADLMGLLGPSRAAPAPAQAPTPLKEFKDFDNAFAPPPAPSQQIETGTVDEIRRVMAHNAGLARSATERLDVGQSARGATPASMEAAATVRVPSSMEVPPMPVVPAYHNAPPPPAPAQHWWDLDPEN